MVGSFLLGTPMRSFPWTLQRYIFRELGKTFALTAIALTGMFGLGGGVLNMVRLGDVTPSQLFRMMALLLPLAAGFTLPIAALFSAAATYGRLSADNEFVACRSSGINMFTLFVPTLVLSLLAGGLSYGLTNYMIPGMFRNLDEMLIADAGALIRQQLDRPRGMRLGDKYRIHADDCVTDPQYPDQVALLRVAFVELDKAKWVRFGTAREVCLRFERQSNRLRVEGWMAGLSYYDRKVGQFVEEARQSIAPQEIETGVARKTKFLNLKELLHYYAHPDDWHEARRDLGLLRKTVGKRLVFDDILADWKDDQSVTIQDESVRYSLQADSAGLLPRGGGVEFGNVQLEEVRGDRRRTITAARAVAEVPRGDTLALSGLRLELRDVTLSDGTTDIDRAKEVLGPIGITPEIIQRNEAFSVDELLEPPDGPGFEEWENARDHALEAIARTTRDVVGTVSERAAFSLSVFVLVILAAVLGIVFRGSHIMTSFGISFVPLLFVLLMIATGKQMARNDATYGLGLVTIWSGLAVVACLDYWTLTRVLRR